MKEKREKRLNSEFQREIYALLSTKVKDVRLTEMFTITSVHTTADLKQAKVFVSIFSTDEAKKQATFEAIKASAGFLRREISARMHIRTVPEFTFILDEKAAYGEKIDKILSGITYSNQPEEDEND
ncbi:MAG: 30S ribosome-binding factor RbfA [Clostridia bacterium]|nr:30S ribosome-binding factor RbfA [Clostridia bacterium]